MRDLGGKYKGFKLLETDEEVREALERARNAPPSPPTHFQAGFSAAMTDGLPDGLLPANATNQK